MAVDPAITGTEQTALNGASTCRAFLSVVPFTTPVATASVTATPSGGTLTQLSVGSTSGWSNVKPGMTVIVKDGSTVRARFRVRKTPDAAILYVNETGFGDPGDVLIANTSTYILSGNSVEIHNTSDLWSVTPRIVYNGGTSGDIYEDYDQTVGTFHTTPYVVVRIYATNSQNYSARHLSSLVADGGTETITWTAVVEKWPPSSGSTVTYAWTVPGSWTGVSGSTTATLTATVPIGYHTLYLTTTDSIGGAFVSTCHVWVHDKTTFPPIRIAEIQNDTESQTDWRLSLRLVDDDIQSIPDGAMVNYWEMGTWNGSVPASNTFTHQRPGWIIRYQMTAEGAFKQTDPEIINPAGVLALLGAFSQYIEQSASPSVWQQAVTSLMTMHFMIFTMLANRCGNLLRLFNYNPLSVSSTSARMPVFKIDAAGSLLAQIQTLARTYYGANFGCDATGEFWFRKNPSLTLNADRASIPTRITLNESRITAPFEVVREFRARTRKVRAEAFTYDFTTTLPTPSLSDAYSNAPGQGVSEERLESQVLDAGQADTNELGGHYINFQNNPYPDIRPVIPKNWPIFKPAQMTHVQMNVAATYMPDGVAFNRLCVVKSVSRRHNPDMTIDTVLTLEAVTQGYPGVTVPIPPEGANTFPELPPLSVLEPILTPPAVVDYGGAFTYTPASLMSLDPTPGAAQAYGRMYLATGDTRVVRIVWDVSGPNYTNISPSSAQIAIIGTVYGMAVNPYNLKQYYLLGDGGIAMVANITATTPVWTATATGTASQSVTVTFDSGGAAYTIEPDDEHSLTGVVQSGGNPGNCIGYGPGDPVAAQIRITFATSVTVTAVQMDEMKNHDGAVGGIIYQCKLRDSSNNLLATPLDGNDGTTAHGTWATQSASSLSVSGVKYAVFRVRAQTGPNLRVYMDNCKVTYSPTGIVSGTPILGTFQGMVNKRNAYCWLSHKSVSGTEYVFFNYTHNAFSTFGSTQIARYNSSMAYGLTVRSDNWRVIYAAAGTPATDAYIYKSVDGGAHFAATALTLNTRGGCCIYNRSTSTPNVRNTLESNLASIKGMDGSNNQQFVKGVSGTPVTIVSDSTRYAYSGLSLWVLPRDLDFIRYGAQEGHFYYSDNLGTTWAASATSIPGAGGGTGTVYGIWGWPSDSQFNCAFGDRVLAYTLDKGANWTDLYSGSYDTWRNANLGATVGKISVAFLPDLSLKYPVPAL